MRIAHLTASAFFGGPERQMLGLAQALARTHDTEFALFPEGGRHHAFVGEARAAGFRATALDHDTPHLRAAGRGLAAWLHERQVGVLFCHGYKANLVGRWAGQAASVPAVAVSRGWTGENLKVKLYETADRWLLNRMDAVVAVSDGQAAKVAKCGVDPHKVRVIRNSARPEAFADADPDARRELLAHFPTPGGRLVVAAGRLSPEKGFAKLVDAARQVAPHRPDARFLIFGDGGERDRLAHQIHRAGLDGKVVLGGFRDDLDRLLPAADVVCLPSYTEGLPNVALEACAAGVPVVATAVGGTPEVVRDGLNGLLVPAGDSVKLAAALGDLIADPWRCRTLGQAGRTFVRERFTFAAQARSYAELIASLTIRQSVALRRAA